MIFDVCLSFDYRHVRVSSEGMEGGREIPVHIIGPIVNSSQDEVK